MHFFKNRFLFIMVISVITLVVLVIGAMSLYEDTSSVFEHEGYIIETTTKTNNKYYFSANTKYKENVDEKIAFSDTESNDVAVDPASFVHYLNGNVSYLKKGVLVNLADLTNPMVSYYNITDQNMIVYENGNYTVTSNGKKISIESFVGRINDNKYLIAGKNLSLKIPTEEARINGDYFEILFIEKGIVKIDNREVSHQVTAQDSYIYVGDNIVISLGDGKIFYENDAKMLLSQITINNDENIDLDVEDDAAGGGGSGSGSGGEGGEGGEGTGEGGAAGETEGDGTSEDEVTPGLGTGEGGSGSGEGADGEGTGGEGSGEGSGEGGSGSGEGISNATATPKIELINANVTSTKIDLSMQLNNAELAEGQIMYSFIDVSTGKEVREPKAIELVNGTFKILEEALTPSTEYVLSIIDDGTNDKTQYFQKTFRTKDLGIKLERVYATDDSLAYRIVFDENTEVSSVHASIIHADGNNAGTNIGISPNEATITKDDIDNLDNRFVFDNLDEDSKYEIRIDSVLINAVEYKIYTIFRVDKTLIKAPSIGGVKVESNAEEVKFTIQPTNVNDPKNTIKSYTYDIYLKSDVDNYYANNMEREFLPEAIHSVTKTDSDPLVLDLNAIEKMNTGVNYKCKIVALYYDNEMYREVTTDYSSEFLIKNKPKVEFVKDDITMNSISGVLKLTDANCTVPMSGRSCYNQSNNLYLRYYKLEDANDPDKIPEPIPLNFNSKTLEAEISLENLSSSTTYVLQLVGDYMDDDIGFQDGVELGEKQFVTTDESEILVFKPVIDNPSDEVNIVNFDAKLVAPNDFDNDVTKVVLNLYSGVTNNKEKLIGTYVEEDPGKIASFFSNFNITNGIFSDATGRNLGLLDSLDKMIKVTNNNTNSLNSAYTIEVAHVYDEGEVNDYPVEDRIHVFDLSSTYYLDMVIKKKKDMDVNFKGVNITPILKGELDSLVSIDGIMSEDEYNDFKKERSEFDDLFDDTTVGIIVESSLDAAAVDSAFTYEKVDVDFVIYNNADKRAGKEPVKKMTVSYGNQYLSSEQIFYLDSSEFSDIKKYFIRGYDYKIGYVFNFTMEDGTVVSYTHDELYDIYTIEKQAPVYTQYISRSTAKDITYRYTFRDIDRALANNNFYYKIGEVDDKNVKYQSIEKTLVADNESHEVTIPVEEVGHVTLAYAKVNTANSKEVTYVNIAEYDFEKEYSYFDEISYEIVNEHNNVLTLKLLNNDITNRAAVYKVVIKDKSGHNIGDYVRYFLASQLSTMSVDTGNVDDNLEPVLDEYKYIGIDYANISKFMGHEMLVYVYAYYDSGLVGFENKYDHGLLLKDVVNNKYLNTYNSSTAGNSSSKIESDIMGMYLLKENYDYKTGKLSIYNQLMDALHYDPLKGAAYYDTDKLEGIGVDYKTEATNAGMLISNDEKVFDGYYNAKGLKEANLKTVNNSYEFAAIVPTIDVNNNGSTINSLKVNIQPYGIYGNQQFVKDGKSHKKVYIALYEDLELTKKVGETLVTDIHVNGSDELGYTATIDSVEFKNLDPATLYYFTVSAYVGGKYTQLYDNANKTTYESKIYEGSTLTAKNILRAINFSVLPTKYNGESSTKKLTWRLALDSTVNYKLRFELYAKDGTKTEVNPETGEELVVPNYKAVKFDGTTASGCNKNTNGTSGNGYVSNCYISVPSANVESINNKDYTYSFTGNDFVFGDDYYKLVVYAIATGRDNKTHELVLYQNDSLKTTTGPVTDNTLGIRYFINIPALNEAEFSLANTLTAGHTDKDGYYISFVPVIKDIHYVIKYGTYTATLKDEKGNVLGRKIGLDASEINPSTIKFGGLSSNTLYYVELTYDSYRNNVGYTDEQKMESSTFTDFIYTPIDAGITLGIITAGQSTAKSVVLTHNGSSNMSENIVRVDYTISLAGSSSKTSGKYIISDKLPSIFTIGADKLPKLTIDVSNKDFSSNTGFVFRVGSGTTNTYIITTEYYYMLNGKETILTDQETGNTKYTTLLNL